MNGKWSDTQAEEYRSRYGERWGDDLALRTYSARLLGGDDRLVLRGGGNTSVKGVFTTPLGRKARALFVKASGRDLATIEPAGHAPLDLEALLQLRPLAAGPADAVAHEIQRQRLDPAASPPSIEALMHAFLPPRYIDHTHADLILMLGNRAGGAALIREALGDAVIVLEYVKPGLQLAQAAAEAFDRNPGAEGMVLLKHGLVTWGDTARESYQRTISLVSRAEEFCASRARRWTAPRGGTSVREARERYARLAPVLRGICAVATGDRDRPHDRFILRPLISADLLGVLESGQGGQLLDSPPVTADHLIFTKPRPLCIGDLDFDDEEGARKTLAEAVDGYARWYDSYLHAREERLSPAVTPFDGRPRVLFIRGLGAVCLGRNVAEADAALDITKHTVAIKLAGAQLGAYEGLDEEALFDMEYLPLQHAKIDNFHGRPLARTVALVTGAAGAIGTGICEALLHAGCHVAATDLPGDALDSLVDELGAGSSGRLIGVPVDVTEPSQVAHGFETVIGEWGGIDLVIPNAGLAHVASLAGMDEGAFRSLERVNIDGTLHVLSEAARLFIRQGTGGDVVLVSTKNVFAPGATFGAYSATKAAAHQLARVASLELAEAGVRVNMVSPDAVFSHGDRASGLWATVGPERMRARGLDERGLEEYYRNRNLLKTAVTAGHVARAVLFFATRQTPTTGATLPVDGGLPDSTPR